jgi:hypothetical protein
MMAETMITEVAWGSMEVTICGQKQHFKDCKVWPGGARAWDWRETGTEHSPGIQPADISELLERHPDAIVLGCGVFGRLRVCEETMATLREQGVPYHVENTRDAVQLFNELAEEGKRVAGLFHSTC